MTTSVTVDAHAGWPVEVRIWPFTGRRGTPGFAWGETTVRIVPPHTRETFYVHSNQDISVHEMQPGEVTVEETI